MRILMKVTMPVDTANSGMCDGTMPTTIKQILTDLKPEAAYFAEDKGQRTAFVFVNINDPSQIPEISEPWFLAFNAAVELHPCMTADDLAKSVPGIEKAVRKYGTATRKAA
jgi:hypothetical protein